MAVKLPEADIATLVRVLQLAAQPGSRVSRDTARVALDLLQSGEVGNPELELAGCEAAVKLCREGKLPREQLVAAVAKLLLGQRVEPKATAARALSVLYFMRHTGEDKVAQLAAVCTQGTGTLAADQVA